MVTIAIVVGWEMLRWFECRVEQVADRLGCCIDASVRQQALNKVKVVRVCIAIEGCCL